MYRRFEGKVVLVTGGNRNTGLAIVERFAREGAKVYMCGSSEESTAKGASALAAMGVAGVTSQACDISDAAQVGALMDTIARESGRLDVLVNNAANQGLGHGGPLEMDAERFWDVLKTNVVGGFQVTQAACNRCFMKQESRGAVVFLSSNTAQRAIRNRTAYCASKGAINSMVRALALDLGPLGIRVNACAPGYIYTERWDALAEKAIDLSRQIFGSGDMMLTENREKLMIASYLGGMEAGFVGVVHPISAGLSMVLGMHHGIANCYALSALADIYPEQHAEVAEWMARQGIDLPKGICRNLTDEQYRQLYGASIVHEKPLSNSLGPDFKQILTLEKVTAIYKSM